MPILLMEFILEASGAKVKEISAKIRGLAEKYKINSNSMLILIVDESINQSIKSTAGSSYESRVEYMMHPLVEDWHGHSHDKNVDAKVHSPLGNIVLTFRLISIENQFVLKLFIFLHFFKEWIINVKSIPLEILNPYS